MRYDYRCETCNTVVEVIHSMSDSSPKCCETCGSEMVKQISCGYIASKGFNPTLEDNRESDHHKKVKDLERAVKMRKKAFGHDAVGDPVDQPDPKHIVKRGKVLGGQEKEIDRDEFIKSASRDPLLVDVAKKALEKKK